MKVDIRLQFCVVIGVALLLWAIQIEWSRRQGQTYSSPIAIVDTIQGIFCPIEVIDHRELNMRFMRCNGTVLGGIHLRTGESAFRAFVIMSAIKHTSRQATKALVVGLGVGSLNRDLQQHGLLVDTVEIEPAVVEAATKHFQWQPNGFVAIDDAYNYFFQTQKSSGIYDYIILDVFTARGSKISRLYSVESMKLLRSQLRMGGTIAVNLVTFIRRNADGKHHPISAMMYNTLKQVFKHVDCYIDNNPQQTPENQAVNFICFASDSEIVFELREQKTEDRDTTDDVLQRFQSWKMEFFESSGAIFTRHTYDLIDAEDEDIHESIEQQIDLVL